MTCKTCYTIWMITLLLAHHTPQSVPTTLQPWLLCVRSLALPLMQIRSQNQLQPQTSWGWTLMHLPWGPELIPSHLSKTISLLEGIMDHQSDTKRSILSLTDKLHFVCQVCRPGRAFLHHMIETPMKAQHLHHRIKLNLEFHRDVKWWLHYLPSWNGVSLLYGSHWLTSAECQFFTDASDTGFSY